MSQNVTLEKDSLLASGAAIADASTRAGVSQPWLTLLEGRQTETLPTTA
jgi:hypothetical protein